MNFDWCKSITTTHFPLSQTFLHGGVAMWSSPGNDLAREVRQGLGEKIYFPNKRKRCVWRLPALISLKHWANNANLLPEENKPVVEVSERRGSFWGMPRLKLSLLGISIIIHYFSALSFIFTARPQEPILLKDQPIKRWQQCFTFTAQNCLN